MQTIGVPPERHFSNNDHASSDLIMSVVPSDLIDCIPAMAYISGRIDVSTQARDEEAISRSRYQQPSQASTQTPINTAKVIPSELQSQGRAGAL